MSKTMEEITADIACVNLNKPVNLVFEDLLKPELSLFIRRRKTNGSLSPELTTGNKISKHIPTLYYFIHILLDRHHSGIDDLKFIYDESFVQMFSRDIEPMKSKNDFPTIYSILVSLKVVEMKSNNEPNKHRNSAMAYYFRLADTYLNAEVVQHQIQVKSNISEKVESGLGKWSVKQQNELDSTSVKGSQQFVHQYETLKAIRFDANQARQHADTLLSQNLIEKGRYNSCMVSINAIENHRIYITRSAKCNRYYTPVTCMPREIRPFIVDKDGKAMNELDYSSFNAFAVYKIVNTWETEFQSNGEKLFFEHELSLYRSLLSGGNFYTDFKQAFLPNEPLVENHIYSARDLPYTTQLVPMAAILAKLGDKIDNIGNKNKLLRWFWCGVFGELYGSANETRYSLDLLQVVDWIESNGAEPKTIYDANFSPSRLNTLRTRNSAAYKGVYAMLMEDNTKDWLSATKIDFSTYFSESIDIHHIFPVAWCEKPENNISRNDFDCIVNKTPLSGRTNRIVSGDAPSLYLVRLKKHAGVSDDTFDSILKSHVVNSDFLYTDNFKDFFADRKEQILNRIEMATGKTIPRDQVEPEEGLNTDNTTDEEESDNE